MPVIYCEIGNHSWEREAKRGRVPKNCPEHSAPKPITVFQRSGSLGRERKEQEDKSSVNLEDLIPGISEFLAQENMETLICEVGNHTWERESRRGKKPKRCPDHSEINSKSIPAQSTARTQDLIAEILSSPRAITCTCPITPDSTPAELRAMESCTSPYYICSTLDTVRRKLNL